MRIFRPEVGYQGVTDAVGYLATTSRAPYSWIEDYSRRQHGYFLTGLPNASDLWEVVACEPDPADRCTFVLSPVKLPNGLPRVDFSKILYAPLRSEAQQHWRKLEKATITHNSHGVVNSSASLSEALLRAFLKAPRSHSRSLSQMLDTLKTELDAGSSAFSPLDLRLMETFRVMHQSSQHPCRAVSNGRSIRPGLAISLAESMAEILTSLGLAQQ